MQGSVSTSKGRQATAMDVASSAAGKRGNECASDLSSEIAKFTGYRCNFRMPGGGCCKAPLNGEFWVTACSHVFCFDHAKQWFTNNDSCPVCRKDSVKMMRLDLSKPESKKMRKLKLASMDPNDVVEACRKALHFWIDQKSFEIREAHKQRQEVEQRQRTQAPSCKTRTCEAECDEMRQQKRKLEAQLAEMEQRNDFAEKKLKTLKEDRANIERMCSQISPRTKISESPFTKESPQYNAHPRHRSMGCESGFSIKSRSVPLSCRRTLEFESNLGLDDHNPTPSLLKKGADPPEVMSGATLLKTRTSGKFRTPAVPPGRRRTLA
mmetsp:Transcript_93716/g.146261  ORF Transcript_93716/g.146261 Transcript_93716/m.146261 type:complete len:323 (+) Transcript_93716:49-1017(+)